MRIQAQLGKFDHVVARMAGEWIEPNSTSGAEHNLTTETLNHGVKPIESSVTQSLRGSTIVSN